MRLSATMICYHSAPTIWSALESIYPYVDEIIIAYGPLADWPFRGDDETLELIKVFPDPGGKMTALVADEWPGRKEMRDATAEKVTGDYHLMIDSDEVWTDMQCWVDWVEAERPLACYAPWVTPWRGLKHWVYSNRRRHPFGWGGKRFGSGLGSLRQRYHFSRWGKGYYWKNHWRVHTPENINLFRMALPKTDLPTRFWHFGYSLPTRYVREKTQYYQFHCPGLPANHRRKEKAKEDAWFGWDGTETVLSIDNPDDTKVELLPADGIPPMAQRAMDRIRKFYDDEDLAFQERISPHVH